MSESTSCFKIVKQTNAKTVSQTKHVECLLFYTTLSNPNECIVAKLWSLHFAFCMFHLACCSLHFCIFASLQFAVCISLHVQPRTVDKTQQEASETNVQKCKWQILELQNTKHKMHNAQRAMHNAQCKCNYQPLTL